MTRIVLLILGLLLLSAGQVSADGEVAGTPLAGEVGSPGSMIVEARLVKNWKSLADGTILCDLRYTVRDTATEVRIQDVKTGETVYGMGIVRSDAVTSYDRVAYGLHFFAPRRPCQSRRVIGQSHAVRIYVHYYVDWGENSD